MANDRRIEGPSKKASMGKYAGGKKLGRSKGGGSKEEDPLLRVRLSVLILVVVNASI